MNISSYKYDLIITRSEPIALHLIHFFLKTQAKKIAMFSDVGYLNPYYSKFFLLKKVILFIIEKKIIDKVNILTHTNRFVIEKYVHNGFESSKFRIFPNPLEISELSDNVEYRDKKCKEIISLAYTGSLYGSRNPDRFFSYLADQENKNFTVYLVGAVRNMYYEKHRFGKVGTLLKNKELNLLKNKIEYFGLNENIKILPFMRKSELEEFIKNNIDILVNIDAPSEVNLFLSSKVVDYIQYNLPILNISNEELL
uniref:Uncharacterized protein n=1 Tax=Conchiformibius kuhniae TaxID=211502 RepID=A0A8T9MU22_9NEIS|nr:hypothetical protein LVJ77_11375 [Conchiformibius kuhniae]